MKVCKFCGSEFENGSGSFCSKSCHAKYASSKVKNHKCNWPRAYTNDGKEWICPYCGETIIGTLNIRKHKSEEIKKYGYHLCKYCGEKFDSSGKAGAHAIYCTKNPNYNELRLDIHKKLSEAGKNCSPELRKHFSDLAKKQGLGRLCFFKKWIAWKDNC